MNIILFVGSGISLASGLAGVKILNAKILEVASKESIFLVALKEIDAKYRGIGGISKTSNGFNATGEIYPRLS